ncbi:MAG: hypothetical protein MJE12_08540 [Alphaproteobacteria bacterium]|nr:hypothetical protein [Alphaproteobacteria bacterium]
MGSVTDATGGGDLMVGGGAGTGTTGGGGAIVGTDAVSVGDFGAGGAFGSAITPVEAAAGSDGVSFAAGLSIDGTDGALATARVSVFGADGVSVPLAAADALSGFFAVVSAAVCAGASGFSGAGDDGVFGFPPVVTAVEGGLDPDSVKSGATGGAGGIAGIDDAESDPEGDPESPDPGGFVSLADDSGAPAAGVSPVVAGGALLSVADDVSPDVAATVEDDVVSASFGAPESRNHPPA